MTQNNTTTHGTNNYKRTTAIVLSGLTVGIITVVIVGHLIFGAVFNILHPNTSDFWQNLVTLAVAVILTVIVGGAAFGVAAGVFYAIVYGFKPPSPSPSPSKKRHQEDSGAT